MTAFSSPNHRRSTTLVAAAFGLASTFAFAACGSPTPIIPEGAWAVSWIDPGADCMVANHNNSIGSVGPDARNDLVEDGELLEEGNDGSAVTVTCSVIEGDAGFNINAFESARGYILGVVVSDLSPDATEAKPGKGTVTYQAPDTAKSFTSENCSFYFLPGQLVKPGEVWLTFTCPDIAGGSNNICTIAPGYVAFSQCTSLKD